ncbi:microtubule-associated protein futsch isoform X2 [Prorops nasuta]|uniref:microtubule-associated protein futsch isoform X2 n=1 Tax=Prorops nasuta TaxID=863751 RepID=UPI0034CF8C4F
MASREKKPLVPSKSKQKANNDSGLPSNETKTKKGKALTFLKNQQVAHEILEAVATGSQLPPKLEASLPRKRALKNLKHKQKIKTKRGNIIASKIKIKKEVPNKNIRRYNSELKKSVQTRKIKQSIETGEKGADINVKLLENQSNSTESEIKEADINKGAKNSLRTKKTKTASKNLGDSGSDDIQDLETTTDSTTKVSPAKVSPKLGKKGKPTLSIIDTASKCAKSPKVSTDRKINISAFRYKLVPKGRRTSGKEGDCIEGSTEHNDSIDKTIDEVIASMLTQNLEGKLTRSRKMLIGDNLISDVEIKKEVETEEPEATSDGESSMDAEQKSRSKVNKVRKKGIVPFIDKILRNGKQRKCDQNPDSLRLDSAGLAMDVESSSSESNGNETQVPVVKSPDEACSVKTEMPKISEDDNEGVAVVEYNNNSGQDEMVVGKVGPTLRSKTKARSTENDSKNFTYEIGHIGEVWLSKKNVDEDEKKLNKTNSSEQIRKDVIISKLVDRPKGRRSSLNIDMKKTVSSFYSSDKSDSNPKSQIDQMIENIKLTIAKSIESKIFGPEKALGIGKSFEVPKIEEVIAPLSTDSQKLGLEETGEEDKPNVSKIEIKSDSTDNSVPKVADTAKEIEKLVMGDIELADTQSQNIQESEMEGIEEEENEEEVEEEDEKRLGESQENVAEECAKNTDVGVEEEEEESPMDVVVESGTTSSNSETCSNNNNSSNTLDRFNSSGSCAGDEETPPRRPSDARGPSKSPVEEVNENDDGIFQDSPGSEGKPQRKSSSPAEGKENHHGHHRVESGEQSSVIEETEDSETLESISREVERLVAENNRENPSAAGDSTKKKHEGHEDSDVSMKDETEDPNADTEMSLVNDRPSKRMAEGGVNEKLANSRNSETLGNSETKDCAKKEGTSCKLGVEGCDAGPDDSSQFLVSEDSNKSVPLEKESRDRANLERDSNVKKMDDEAMEDDCEADKSIVSRETSSDGNVKASMAGDNVNEVYLESKASEDLRIDGKNKPNDEEDSSESSNSSTIGTKILETPEDKERKESILRLLGLESLEKAAERLNHQKARKEQQGSAVSSGTLKTVIRVQKEKDKKRSRSPLKMVLKQGKGDGEGDAPEFYTIQKEFGTSGLGDSSSGANRKFTTNHRHSCEEDNEEASSKDRQSLVIPEKSSSFSIHPERLCADVCCYCFGKFGCLDTPMHLAQMKSDERRKKILAIERHLTKDSCLCDACYRHVYRKANLSPTNMQPKPQKQHRQLMVSKCSVRECRDAARHHVKRRWLLKIKQGLQIHIDIDWESSQHTSMSFCVSHYSQIERFLTCALCTRRLARNHTHQLASTETDELNDRLNQQGIPVLLAAGTFVCKLCRYFTQLQLKYKDVENMSVNHKSFFKSYRKRILHYHDIEVEENEEDDCQSQLSRDKDKRKKTKVPSTKTSNPKSPETTNSNSEKSTPEPTSKNEISETEIERSSKATTDMSASTEVQFVGLESTVEKLKKRRLLDIQDYMTNNSGSDASNEVVEILAMDKEVTLTRLPKRPRTNNDITPVVQRLGANPSISVRTLFPGEEEMNLHANVEFTNVREITPQGWEKCATMIQYDRDTKMLWQELQRPYGNQSSFLRHLILLEKYYRSGDLILAPNASRNAINYSTSVQNRLISYEGPEKMDEPIIEPISEYNNSRRLSGGYVMERDRLSLPSTSSMKGTSQPKSNPPKVLKLNSGVSIIKKPPPSLQRLNLPSTSSANAAAKRKDGQKFSSTVGSGGGSSSGGSGGGKVFQLSEPEFKRLQNLKKQKQMLNDKSSAGSPGSNMSSIVANSMSASSQQSLKNSTQYQKAQLAAQTQFQKHLRMQQEMLNRQSRGDFEPLICDIRALANENSPTQNLLHNLNLPKSIQVTTKPSSNPVPILPKIPKSLTVIPQTVTRPEK